MNPPEKKATSIGDDDSTWIAIVREKVQGLRFGAVQIFVHDSRVVQIEKTERTRLDHPKREPKHPDTQG